MKRTSWTAVALPLLMLTGGVVMFVGAVTEVSFVFGFGGGLLLVASVTHVADIVRNWHKT